MSDREIVLTPKEKKAIADLQRLASSWPESLWLFSASGTLNVMRVNEDGDRQYRLDGGLDQDYIVAIIHGIDNEGGDW